MRRLSGALGIGAPVLAVPVVLLGGLVTPGYDPVRRTISRLAEPGLPAAFAVGSAIFVVGLALLGLAVALGPRAVAGRVLLGIAGASLLVAAAIPLDPASERASTVHRVATTIAMLALVCGPLAFAPSLRRLEGWRGYGPVSFGLGTAAIGVLLIGLVLLPTTFAVGAWERCFLALPMAWMVLVSARLLRTSSTDPMLASTAENSSWPATVSAHETMNAAAASASNSRL
jgi:Protein of unknown function (DUF998)